MTHSPPIPPGNQPPYPRVEPPHAKPAATESKKSAEPTITAKTSAKARELAPALIAGAVVAGAAAIATVVVRSRRKAEDADNSGGKSTKSKNSGSGSASKGKKSKAKGADSSSDGASKASGDDKSIRGPQDSSRIAMNEDYEVRYWTEKFGVDRDALQKAVDAVGNGADAVERELGKA